MADYAWHDAHRRRWIGERIVELRGTRTQKEIAGRVSIDTLSRAERGLAVSEASLREIAAGFGIGYEDLIAPPGIGRVAPLCRSVLGEHELATPWLRTLMRRLAEALPAFRCIDRMPIDASAAMQAEVLELGPMLLDWPRRVLESPRWSCMDSPMRSIPTLSLDQAWVDLQIHPPAHGSSRGLELPELLDRRRDELFARAESPEFVLDRLGSAAVVLGRPGAGKSTFLKWLLRAMLRASSGRYLLPLFVRLRDFAKVRRTQTDLDLVEFALYETCGMRSKPQRELWLNALGHLSGHTRETVVLLLDGWDELAARERDELEVELDRYNHGYALLMTSRYTALPSYFRHESFHEIADLDASASDDLIARWFAAMERPAQADPLRSLVAAQPELAQLTRNPFTTTILCALAYHEDPGAALALPPTRAAIYERTVALTVEQYETERTKATTLALDASRLRSVGKLAYDLYGPPGGQQARHIFDEGDVTRATGDGELLALALAPSRLIGQVEGHSGNYQFVHATYHEYFVARHLEAMPVHELGRLLAGYALDTGWLVIALFLAGARCDRSLLELMVRSLVTTPDRFGLVHVRAAWLLAEAGVRDGGQAMLGIDVRDVLWAGIERGVQINIFRDAYLLLDRDHLVARTIAACEQGSTARRVRMGRLLRQLPSPRVVEQLLADLLGNDETRAALATYGDERVLSTHDRVHLRERILDAGTSDHLRRRMLRLLANLHDRDSLVSFEQLVRRAIMVHDSIWAIGRVGGERAATLLLELLGQQLAPVDEVYAALGDTRAVRGRDALLAALAVEADAIMHDNQGTEARLEALLDALVDLPIGSREAVAVVLRLLEHAESSVIRAQAAAVLASATAAGVGTALLRATHDPEQSVRIAALAALREHPSPHHGAWLREVSRDESRNTDEREAALRAFLVCCASHARIPGWAHLADEALSEVELAMTSSHATIRLAALAHADAAGPRVVPLLSEVLVADRDTHREEACRTLGRIGSPEASRLLATLVAAASSAPDDEAETNFDTHTRAWAEAARALAACDPLALLTIDNDTAAHALEQYAAQTGSLVYIDHILDARGRRITRRGVGSP